MSERSSPLAIDPIPFAAFPAMLLVSQNAVQQVSIVLDAEFGANLPRLLDRTFLIPDYHHLATFVPSDRPPQ
jgi:hypothetical protein